MELHRQPVEHSSARPTAGIEQTFHENSCRVRALLSRWLKSGFWQFHWGNFDIQLSAVRDASNWPIHAVLSTVKYAAGAAARIESSVTTVTLFRASVF
jgi:hypothetical protein